MQRQRGNQYDMASRESRAQDVDKALNVIWGRYSLNSLFSHLHTCGVIDTHELEGIRHAGKGATEAGEEKQLQEFRKILCVADEPRRRVYRLLCSLEKYQTSGKVELQELLSKYRHIDASFSPPRQESGRPFPRRLEFQDVETDFPSDSASAVQNRVRHYIIYIGRKKTHMHDCRQANTSSVNKYTMQDCTRFVSASA